MLEHLFITQQTARFRALDPLTLPEYKGATFRGALGHAFRKVSCPIVCRDQATCLLRYRCAYSICFETPVPEDAALMRKYPYAPHPFVLEPPLDARTQYEAGEDFEVRLCLIGRGNDYVAHFIYAFDELGKAGLGRGRGKAELVALETKTDGAVHVLYDKGEDKVRGEAPAIRGDVIAGRCEEFKERPLRITFMTPTRVKARNTFVTEPTLETLFPSLLRRLNSLNYFHCGGAEGGDVRPILDAARNARTSRCDVRWVDWERYSGRQEVRMKLGGFVGTLDLEPLDDILLLFLVWGELVHLGKASAFGLGQYRLEALG